MKFCSQCGSARIEHVVPMGDSRPRHVCPECATIYYQNPKIVAGCLPVYGDRVLLCRRAIEPRHGFWTLPAGFMENEETTVEAAMRETREEANANVEIEQLYTLINLPHVSQVYMMYRAKLLDLDFHPGAESLEVALFTEDTLPWNALAFPTVAQTLRFYFEDRQRQDFLFRAGDIVRVDGQPIYLERRPSP
ncbi:MAG: NUDIX hydrolase [Gammaproteobacteria bacterium]|nr:NUDIX hydrolase [Gammaproteobacteria bacterium]